MAGRSSFSFGVGSSVGSWPATGQHSLFFPDFVADGWFTYVFVIACFICDCLFYLCLFYL